MKRVLALCLAVALAVPLLLSADTPTTITWTKQTNPVDVPALMHYTSGQDDPVSGCVLWWVNPNGSSDIYGTALQAYCPDAVDKWVLAGGSSASGNDCTSHLSASPLPWPPNRHVTGNWMIDQERHIGVLIDGVCATDERNDEWALTLFANPTSDTWTEIEAADTIDLPVYGWLVKDTIHDIYIAGGMTAGGGGEVWVKCPTGSLSGDQTTAGCVTPGVWARTVTTGASPQPTGNMYNDGAFNSAWFDTSIGKVRLFANRSQTSGGREHWLYTPLTKAWIDDTANVVGMPSYNTARSTGYKDTAQITSGPYAGMYVVQKDSRSSDCTDPTQTYLFNGTTNTYSTLTMNGNGPGCATMMAFNSASGKIVTFGGLSGVVEVWHGELSGGAGSSGTSRIRLRIRGVLQSLFS